MTIEQKLKKLGYPKYFMLYDKELWLIYTYNEKGKVTSGWQDTLEKAVNELVKRVKGAK